MIFFWNEISPNSEKTLMIFLNNFIKNVFYIKLLSQEDIRIQSTSIF